VTEDSNHPAGRPRLPLETSRAGVFAVGDARSGSVKRVASAVGEGSMAVRLVYEHHARVAL
jgi:thioredoxin reductase (NADPH)